MRIVFLADAPYPHTWRWVHHFAAAGHDCHVISFRPARIEGATVHHVDGVERLGKARYLLHARRVARLIRELQPDLLHALHLTSYGFLGSVSGFHPFLASVWGTDILEAPQLTPFHRWLTRHALAHADAITATGLHLALETTRYAPYATPVTVVPYGVDLQRFTPRSNGAQPQSGVNLPLSVGTERGPGDEVSPLFIGTTARLSPEKGLSYLVDAFARLRERYGERVRLCIAGEGPERSALEQQIDRLRLGEAVELAGWLEHDEVPAFLQRLDVFTLPSTWEGFGVSAVEASACGLPVVASNIHGIPDAVLDGTTGLLVPPRDPTALAKALGRLIDDPSLRSRLGEAGRAFVARNYDWRQNVRQMELVYQGLASTVG
jgi:glycosyltransferase involved in cell wall biosynthesis